MANLKPDTTLRDRYRIVGLIGSGGMGAVYLAHDSRLEGRRCAIKEQLVDNALSSAARTQFRQEASLLARLDHPGLPKVSDYFFDEDSNREYLVMDYVPGQNLEQLIKKAQRDGEFLSEAKILGWLDQLCDILVYLHSRQPVVLHRDIKPANIKLTPDDRLKLVDFGLAKPFDPGDPRTITGLQGLGSLPYTPLEQYVGHLGHTDGRTDLYALGATCYHLITGEPPASAHSRFLNADEFLPPQQRNPNVSPTFADAIVWAMKLHPTDRPDSVAAWHNALKSHTIQLPSEAAIAKPEESGGNLFGVLRDNALLFGIALLLLLLALLITFAR